MPESLSYQLARAMEGSSKKILFVEDDPTMVSYMKELAKEYQIEIHSCPGAKQALQELESETFFHAAILDVRLTNGDGVSLYQIMVSRFPQIKVIFLTGYDSAEIRQKIEEIGPAMVFSKNSIQRPDFMQKLMGLIGAHRREFSPV